MKDVFGKANMQGLVALVGEFWPDRRWLFLDPSLQSWLC